ncbi:hypothetical protein CASFOL_025853 [Castilleja foliolosa]|uniref:Uncharacterized protein n=1 Tax=Castilleja foliolosa TaxID=1961234 RepID=A0ABD3CUU2_9LAMI
MKFFSWMQNKFNGGQSDKRPNAIPSTNNTKILEPPKEEFNDWPHGLLTIGTFGNTDNNLKNKQTQIERNYEIEIPRESQCLSPDFSEFTAEEVVKLEKELKKLLTKKQASNDDLPLDRFLNCPSSLEMDRSISNRLSIYSDDKDHEEEIDRTIRIILGRCKDICEKRKKKTISKKSLAFLVKKIFVCSSGFAPTPSLRDTFQESRMEKLMRTLLTKKIYSQNSYRASSSKKYLEDYRPNVSKTEEKEEESKKIEGSKWDKTDSEYIVLDI